MKKIIPEKKLSVPEKPIAFNGDVPVEGKTWKKLGQIATRYQVSKRTIAYWKSDGTLPFYQKGRVVRFDAVECDRAMEVFRLKARHESA